MTPVKLNVYISYAPDDRKAVLTLRDWLYPMRDEVNIWFNDPPKAPAPLSLPWELISYVLPFFRSHDWRKEYAKVDKRRKERAHIYLFMTSYKSLIDNRIDDDITLAAERRIEGDWLSPRIYPVVVSPSLWKERSRLARYKPIGPKKSLAETKPAEEGYLEITQQLSKVIKEMQRDLDEAKFAKSRLSSPGANASPTPSKTAQPYLGDDDDLLEFRAPAQSNPPEWLGWSIIFLLIIFTAQGLRNEMPRVSVGRYENARPANAWQPEYRREHPLMPPKVDKPFPPPE